MEYWRPVKDYETIYEVSSNGQVRSLDRYIQKGPYIIHRNGKLLKLSIGHGYLYVSLAKSGRQQQKFVHVLVAEAFLDKPNGKVEVNHKDGNKLNNCVDNLEWVTHRENIQHSFRLGLHKYPDSTYMKQLAMKASVASKARSAKPVLCETDGLAFESQHAADRFYGYYLGTVNTVLKKSNPVFKGNLFRLLLQSELSNYTLLS